MYVLIVDDEPAIRSNLTSILEHAGHRVCTASTGDGALQQMRLEHPDVVLLDMILGEGMSGWEVADEKRRDRQIASIPTIILSGLAPEDVRLRGVQPVSILSEIKIILQKPMKIAHLLKIIEHIGALGQFATA